MELNAKNEKVKTIIQALDGFTNLEWCKIKYGVDMYFQGLRTCLHKAKTSLKAYEN